MADYDRSPASIIALSQPCDDEDEEANGLRRSRSAGEACRSISTTSVRKPRGRPPGSKNKPKPPVVITRDSESSMHPVVLELAAGSDILDCVAAFARRRRIGVSILGASGVVSSLALRQPATPSATFTLSGRFDILSLSGSFLPPGSSAVAAAGFTISVAGTRGEVIGGAVGGPVTAAGTVVVFGASFVAAEFQRLPAEVEEEGGREDVATAGEGFGVLGPGKQLTSQLSHDMVLWATPASSRSFSAPHLRPPSHF
ncbi:hypothetical protein KFK09_002371 [Dendrobium nobile]|uniref:PPC domain-containing protein n=1 Tax=Dendrobium nobile TaxID=94219 RepID=A0A8T3C695_DENNO|nr:hypothetical protein KFK09_002371 [Dendrobium nobile]